MRKKYHAIATIIALVLFLSSIMGIEDVRGKDTEKLFREVLHKPFYLRANKLKQLFGQIVALPGKEADKLINRFKKEAQGAGDEPMVLEMRLLRVYYNINRNKMPMGKAVKAIQSVAEDAAGKKIWAVQMRALKQIAKALWTRQKYEHMFRAFVPIEKLIEEAGSTYSPARKTRIKLAGSAYSNIAEAYLYFGNYSKTIYYLKKAVALPLTKYNVFERVRAWNNFGLCYKKTGEFEKSSRYLKKIINYRPQRKLNPLWVAIAKGNLGYNYYRMGRYDEAIPLLKADIKVSETVKLYGEAAIATINLIKVRLEQGRLKQAGRLILPARKNMRLATHDDKLHFKHELYTVMSKWYAAVGDRKKAVQYIDSMRAAIKIHNQNFNLHKLMRARQKNHRQQRKILMAQKQQQVRSRNIIISFVLLLFIGSLVAYAFRNRYLQRKQEIKDLQLAKTTGELEHARSQIKNFAQRVKKNNNVIDRLKRSGKGHSEYTDILQEIKNSSLLTDDDWIQFKELFNQVHPHYIDRLKRLYPDLTTGQVRFMVLVKLQFNRNEMANILGISPQSLRVTWYRIRKKLDIPKETTANELAESVGKENSLET